MSAFICSDKHISAIVRWACINNIANVAGKEQEVVDLLHAENVKSVNYRYGSPDPGEGAIYDTLAPNLSPVEVIKACQCLDYQSCEHPGWEGSWAKERLGGILQAAIAKLPGYTKAQWHID